MTRATKPVWRAVVTKRGEMAVAIAPAGILIRRKGSRTTYGPVPFTALEDLGAKLEAAGRGHVTARARRSRSG